MELLRKGKVKEAYIVDDGTLEFVFTDNISVFDKVIPTRIARKGEILCRTSAHWFQTAASIGLESHFKRMADRNRMLVRRFDIIEDYDSITPQTKGYLIPLEFICRHYVAGSLHDRLSNGQVPPDAVGLPKGRKVEYGAELPEPFFEMTTKLEETDRLLSDAEALDISGVTRDDYEEIREAVLKLDERMAQQVRPRGLLHVDGKKEFAFGDEREVVIIDTFGTPDEDRWWDREAFEEGRFVELSKEAVRQHYRKTGYHGELYRAREAGRPEPEIPPLPADLAEATSHLYVEMYTKLTGEELPGG